MTNYIILLPPSEGKKKEGENSKIYRVIKNLKKYNSFIHLEIERELVYTKILEALSNSSEEQLEKIFELKSNKLQEAIEVQSDLLNERCMKAIERYDGVMFKAIDYETIENKESFNNSIVFIDGQFGILKPQDLIPDYKLKINSKLPDLNIQKFWKERLEPTFKEILKDKVVINLLPEAHSKVVNYSQAKEVIKITFSEMKGNKVKTIGHFSKHYKGEFIRELTKHKNITKEQILAFKHSAGHKYSKEHSKENNLVFLKD